MSSFNIVIVNLQRQWRTKIGAAGAIRPGPQIIWSEWQKRAGPYCSHGHYYNAGRKGLWNLPWPNCIQYPDRYISNYSWKYSELIIVLIRQTQSIYCDMNFNIAQK